MSASLADHPAVRVPPDERAVTPLPREAPGDAELVARALEGDRWAEEALYRRHVHRVTTLVARLLRHGPDVEDVVQDAFIEAYRDLAQLRDPARVGAWIARIAVHRCHKRFRRRKLRRLLGLERGAHDEPLALQARVDAGQDARAELALLDRALDALPVAERTCWVLRHLEGYRLAEVAELAGCSLATAKRRLRRAQDAVRAHFEEGPDAA